MALPDLIARSYDQEAADAYRSYSPSVAELELLKQKASCVLSIFENEPGACVKLSVLCAAAFQQVSDAPIYVVAGSLADGDTYTFGSNDPVDGGTIFSNSDPSWNGHAWIVLGEWMLDISLLRTAYSSNSPPTLTNYVNSKLGGARNPIVCRISDALGLRGMCPNTCSRMNR